MYTKRTKYKSRLGASNLAVFVDKIVFKLFVYVIFLLPLKKENLPDKAVTKDNVFLS